MFGRRKQKAGQDVRQELSPEDELRYHFRDKPDKKVILVGWANSPGLDHCLSPGRTYSVQQEYIVSPDIDTYEKAIEWMRMNDFRLDYFI